MKYGQLVYAVNWSTGRAFYIPMERMMSRFSGPRTVPLIVSAYNQFFRRKGYPQRYYIIT